VIRMMKALPYYSQTILFRTRSARTTSNVHAEEDPTADAKAVSSDHSYSRQCLTGFCSSLLTSLAQAIRDKEKEIQQLHCQLAKLRVKRPRMTLTYLLQFINTNFHHLVIKSFGKRNKLHLTDDFAE
jgi:hypothetical protein